LLLELSITTGGKETNAYLQSPGLGDDAVIHGTPVGILEMGKQHTDPIVTV
jgi:hypothetical protein